MKHKRIIAITGGIATGKSTLSNILIDKGFSIIDADKIAHYLMRKGQANYKDIVNTFGCNILTEDGEIDREILSDIVFNDKNKLEELNKIVHINIIKEMDRQVKELSDKEKIIFLDIPLLFESKNKNNYPFHIDEIWLVYTNQTIQIERLMKRDSIPVEKAEKIIYSQMSIEKKKKLADFIFYNNGSIDELNLQIEDKIREIRNEIS